MDPFESRKGRCCAWGRGRAMLQQGEPWILNVSALPTWKAKWHEVLQHWKHFLLAVYGVITNTICALSWHLLPVFWDKPPARYGQTLNRGSGHQHQGLAPCPHWGAWSGFVSTLGFPFPSHTMRTLIKWPLRSFPAEKPISDRNRNGFMLKNLFWIFSLIFSNF